MNLLSIDFSITNPERNLAIEEKLLKIADKFYALRFWVNEPCMILGRFQKLEYPVNQDFLRKNNIPVLKCFSGGGTVYHDLGNLNITFCKPRKPALHSSYIGKEGNFVTQILRDALQIREIKLSIDERNGVYFGDKKLLGSAITLKKGKFFYHASLLVNADLKKLRRCINWAPDYPKDDGNFVKSNRGKVINLTQIYPITFEEIKLRILEKFKEILEPTQTIIIKEENQLRYFMKIRKS